MKPISLKSLLQRLREGSPINVEMSQNFSRTLFYENETYYEQTPEGRRRISREEALLHLRMFIARAREERREQRKGKR